MTAAARQPQTASLDRLLVELRGCRICAKHLQLGPRPVLQVARSARILILSQAPGTRVHETGLNFNDRSGDRLREWMGVSREIFYDDSRVAVMGMAFCYPGRDAKGGDLPPRPECAPRWHPALLAELPQVALSLLVGSYAIDYYMAEAKRRSMTATVKAWRTAPAGTLPLPHPSWRTTAWEKNNPWFRRTLIPELRRRVAALL
ncbi:MAG: uracil-DNA glycosylase family protein [Stellaceae bacterium]